MGLRPARLLPLAVRCCFDCFGRRFALALEAQLGRRPTPGELLAARHAAQEAELVERLAEQFGRRPTKTEISTALRTAHRRRRRAKSPTVWRAQPPPWYSGGLRVAYLDTAREGDAPNTRSGRQNLSLSAREGVEASFKRQFELREQALLRPFEGIGREECDKGSGAMLTIRWSADSRADC